MSDPEDWFKRNAATISSPLDLATSPLGETLSRLQLPERGRFVDVGGANGHLAAGIKARYPGWNGVVVDHSSEACVVGQKQFPELSFVNGCITERGGLDGLDGDFDLVIIAGVFSMLPRSGLAQTIANLDLLTSPRLGKIVIRDFASAFPSVTESHHSQTQKIYKQDYSRIFTGLGTYHLVFSEISEVDSSKSYDPESFFDLRRVTQVLEKNATDDFYSR